MGAISLVNSFQQSSQKGVWPVTFLTLRDGRCFNTSEVTVMWFIVGRDDSQRLKILVVSSQVLGEYRTELRVKS